MLKAAFEFLFNNAVSITAVCSVIMILAASPGVHTSAADRQENCTRVTTPGNDTSYSFRCFISDKNNNMP
jgi:hypothetical protein